jgi:NAD(P)-dependent dehydrogenase (short-subunit alcohol dehydrogenase family)
MDMDGKVGLVTGAGSGIGLATADLLAERGATVVAADLSTPPAERDDGGRIEHVRLDVTEEAAVASAIGQIVARHGRLDFLVTAAGIQRYGTAADTRAEQWREVMAVNLDGAFHAVKHALPWLRASGTGAIVLVSSVQAFVTQSGVAAYTASKGGLVALTRSIAVDEAAHGVRANAVCPGSVDTPMLRWAAARFSGETPAAADELVASWGRSHPLGRVAQPREVAEAIAFLLSERASFITGVALPVDGGLLAKAAVILPD